MQGEHSSILIIEDDTQLRSISSKMVSLQGYKPLQAENRETGLQIIHRYPYLDKIILDVNMPGMSMSEFIDHVHQLNQQRDIEIIFSTGHSPDEIEQLMQKYTDIKYHFLQKPYGLEKLQEVLESL